MTRGGLCNARQHVPASPHASWHCPRLHDVRAAGALIPSTLRFLASQLLFVPRVALGRERNSDRIEADVGLGSNDFRGADEAEPKE